LLLSGRGPGFKQHVLDALRRIDRNLSLVWCGFRGHWLVVRAVGATRRAWWNGEWHTGFEVVIRWLGVDGVFRAAFPYEERSFLPLDNRLVLVVRAGDISRRASASDLWREAEEIDERREEWRASRKRDVRAEARRYWHTRHVANRTSSIGGFAPGAVNDYATEGEVRQEMSARMRRAMNRVRAGLPMISRID